MSYFQVALMTFLIFNTTIYYVAVISLFFNNGLDYIDTKFELVLCFLILNYYFYKGIKIKIIDLIDNYDD